MSSEDINNNTQKNGNESKEQSPTTPKIDIEEEKSDEEEEEIEKFNIKLHRPFEENLILRHIWGKVTEPNASKIKVRSKHYIRNKRKISSDNILCPLVGVECWKIPKRLDHIASLPFDTWYRKHVDPEDSSVFFIIMHLQVASINASFITYHALEGGLPASTDDEIFNKLFTNLISNGDEYRKKRLKIIPNIISGPFAVQRMVPNKPCLLGTKVNHRYFRGKNYLEIDAEVDSSYLSSSIIKLCYKASTKIVVDICWVIQGENDRELPERVMIAHSMHNIDFTKIPNILQYPFLQKEKKKKKKVSEQDKALETSKSLSKIVKPHVMIDDLASKSCVSIISPNLGNLGSKQIDDNNSSSGSNDYTTPDELNSPQQNGSKSSIRDIDRNDTSDLEDVE